MQCAYNSAMDDSRKHALERCRFSLHMLLILSVLLLLASLATFGAWYGYLTYLERVPLTPIPVPTPPGV